MDHFVQIITDQRPSLHFTVDVIACDAGIGK